MAQTIAFYEYEEKTFHFLSLINRLHRQTLAIGIFFILHWLIFKYKQINKLQYLREYNELKEQELKEFLVIFEQIRNRLDLLIPKLRNLQDENPFLFRNSVLEKVEEMEEYFDSQVENLQFTLDPEINKGVHKVIANIGEIKENSEPWRNSLAKI